VEKQKELRYAKALQKSGVGPSTPFHFDVMAQLANIPAQITLYELLRLSKSRRDVLREALADTEIFSTQIPATCIEDDSDHVTTPRSSFPASPSPLKTCKSKRNIIDPCITQSISDHLK